LDVYVALIPEQTVMPYNLAMALVESGVQTMITLGKREYHFNVTDSVSKDHLEVARKVARARSRSK
jgi:hypothetical protein